MILEGNLSVFVQMKSAMKLFEVPKEVASDFLWVYFKLI